MACRTVSLANGGIVIVCSRGEGRSYPNVRRCIVCNRPETMCSIKLCDADVGNDMTCDAVVCRDHAVHREPDTDYCPRHATA
jgi:hypothetical protein